ncbi:MaoC family dehydratase [Eoetvoesiella caeni]|uniref:Acyl dehydratase n=1 Tax=Eoetvoesiella caeni TaxID=645616 RepID=A0A366H7V4_9BURK|nr:MaoC family dehydratase [Eoetvoesiella caeni]MCI2809859.1 MaoC family dehydratase [Eoetvoesiella caeni]NYT56224.1 MaoC family dehydratase [Eoetvoesiella caeni]RBP38282.1 acyl dehydratase [Eoetvoesiella caeni]
MHDSLPTLYFLDDLAVGQRFNSATYELTEDKLIAFASEYDPQPFHLDKAAAEATLFKGLAASGWHTAAITMKLLNAGGAPLAGGIIGAGGQVEWPRPTRPGDVLRVVSEVMEIIPSRSKPQQGIAVMRCETRNQNDEVLQILTAKLIVPRRPQ